MVGAGPMGVATASRLRGEKLGIPTRAVEAVAAMEASVLAVAEVVAVAAAEVVAVAVAAAAAEPAAA